MLLKSLPLGLMPNRQGQDMSRGIPYHTGHWFSHSQVPLQSCKSRILYLRILGPLPAHRNKDIGIGTWRGGGCAPGDSHSPGLSISDRRILQFIISPPDDWCLRKNTKHMFFYLINTFWCMELLYPAATKNCLFHEKLEKFNVTLGSFF